MFRQTAFFVRLISLFVKSGFSHIERVGFDNNVLRRNLTRLVIFSFLSYTSIETIESLFRRHSRAPTFRHLLWRVSVMLCSPSINICDVTVFKSTTNLVSTRLKHKIVKIASQEHPYFLYSTITKHNFFKFCLNFIGG